MIKSFNSKKLTSINVIPEHFIKKGNLGQEPNGTSTNLIPMHFIKKDNLGQEPNVTSINLIPVHFIEKDNLEQEPKGTRFGRSDWILTKLNKLRNCLSPSILCLMKHRRSQDI